MKKLSFILFLLMANLIFPFGTSNAQNPCLATWVSHPDSVNHLITYFSANNTSNDYYYKWTFGDNTTSTNRTPVHTYAHAGSYVACLVVTKKDSSCTNYFCDSVLVPANAPPPCIATWTWKTDSINHLNALFNANNTSNDFNYKWTFGDGGTSTLRTPSHTYLNAGKYKVCLIVQKKDSTCANYVCDSIIVSANTPPPCIATWTWMNDSANHLKAYFFANNTSNDFYYKWTFGDGTNSDLRTPSHTYLNAGKYKVCLIVTRKDSSCANYVCDSIAVSGNNTPPPCLATWTWKTDSANHLKAYFFANNTSTDFYYKWTFGDGTSSDLRTPSHTYLNAGKYKVCLIVTKKDSSCTNYVCDSIPVSVAPPPPCNGNWTWVSDSANHFKAYFFAVSTSADFYYNWSFGDGTYSDNRTPVHTYALSGKYQVCLRVMKKDSSCVIYKCDSIQINNNPPPPPCLSTWTWFSESGNTLNAHFNAANTSSDFYYKWYFGDGTTSDLRTPIHSYLHAGKYKVCLSVIKKDSSCMNYVCDSIVIQENIPCLSTWNMNFDSINHLKIYFKASNTSNDFYYKWSFGDGTSSDNKTPTHIYNHDGKYKVCLKVTKKDTSCSTEHCDSIVVSANSGCEAAFTFTKSNKEVHFTNTSAGAYNRVKWSFGDNTGSDLINPVHVYTNNNTYTVCLTIFRVQGNDTLCTSKKCYSVVITSGNNACVASFTKTINNSQKKVTFTNTSSGSNLISFWTFGDDSVSTSASPVHYFAHNGTYHVCLRVMNASDTTCRGEYCENIKVNSYDTMVPASHAVALFEFASYNPFQNSIKFTNTSTGNALTYNWDFGDGESSDLADPIHSFAQNEWYLVCLQVADASSNDVYCQSVRPAEVATGVQNVIPQTTAPNTLVYPNPFKDKLNIILNSKTTADIEIIMSDIQGRTVLTHSGKLVEGQNEINLETSDIPGGFYLIRMNTNGMNQVIKVIK